MRDLNSLIILSFCYNYAKGYSKFTKRDGIFILNQKPYEKDSENINGIFNELIICNELSWQAIVHKLN